MQQVFIIIIIIIIMLQEKRRESELIKFTLEYSLQLLGLNVNNMNFWLKQKIASV